jgi:hypothetical protein
LLSAGSLGAAAYFWNQQRSLAVENATLRARVLITPEPGVPVPPKLATSVAKSDAPPKEEASPAGDRPPALSAEEEARRKEFEAKREALQKKESDTRHLARIHLLKTRLNLTPEQEAMVADRLQQARDERRAARENFKPGQPPDFAEMQKMMKLDQIAAADIRAGLTPEQQTGFDALRAEERADRAEEQANRQLGEWQQYLKMSPEQKDAVFQVLSEQSMANDPENQPDARDFDEVRSRMEAQQAAQREALAAVLDETQMAIFDDLNQTRRETFQGFGPGGGGPPPGFRGPPPGGR